jgi:hypothetical protein
MANDLVFRISAIDNASKVAGKVRGALARVTDPVGRLTQRLAGTGKLGAAALGKVDAGLRTVAQTARSVSDRIASIVPGMAALTGLAGTAGIGALAERWGSLGFNLQRTSRQLGMSTQSLQAWHYAAQRAGVTAEQFDQSMVSSQNTIREAAFGANPQAMMLLNRLGVQISRTKDGQIDYQRTQADILTALGKVKNPAGQRTAADALGMGALLPMIQRGTYKTDRQQAIANGYAPSEDAIQRAAAFRDRITDLTSGASALANTIGDKLVPVLTPMIEKLSTWLSENRVDIANRLADAVAKFTSWITSVDWDGWYKRVNGIVDAFGGWGSVLRDIVAIKFGATLVSWTASIATLAATLVTAKTAAQALKGVAGAGAAAGTAEGTAAAGAGAAAARAPWLARIFNPYMAGAAALFYSKDLNEGEADVLARARKGEGKRYLTPGEYAPRGTTDPKILAIAQKFQDMGWSKAQAAGIAANILQESGGNPYSVGDNGRAYGVGQWHADRQADFKRVFGKDIRDSDLDEQLKFFDWELRKGPGMQRRAGELLQRADSANAAAAIVSKYHERPADVEGEQLRRGAMADQIFRSMGGGAGADSTAAAPATQGAGTTTGASANAGTEDSHDKLVEALSTAVQRTPVQVTVNAPPGTRVETNNGDGAGMPARVQYQMLGAMP